MSSGFENAVAVYSVRALSVPPQPQVGARRTARVTRVTTTRSDREAQPADDREAERRGRHLRERAGADCHRQRTAAQGRCRGQSGQRGRHDAGDGEDDSWEHAQRETRATARKASGTSIVAGDSCASSAARLRGSARNADAERLDEADGRQRARERQERAGQREVHAREPRHELEPEQQRLKRQPFAGEAVQRRETRDRERADEKEHARPRHPAQEAADRLELTRGGRHHHAARAPGTGVP